jgi:hypothetical protein
MKKLDILRLSITLSACFLYGCENSDFTLTPETSTPYDADILYIKIDKTEILKVLNDSITKVYNDFPEIGVNIDADLSSIAPRFILSHGASIKMQDSITGEWSIDANGMPRDFRFQGQEYIVVSANGKIHRKYILSFNKQESATRFRFEWFALNDSSKGDDGEWKKNIAHYYTWREYDDDGNYRVSWCTANSGYGISKSNNPPHEYPTTPCDGVNGGYGVKLTSMPTGGVAEMMNIRLAAGNIFLGEFDMSTALWSPTESTKFGIPFNRKPLAMRGWMSYVPGGVFQNKEGHIINGADSCNIYAVLYKNHDNAGNAIILDGKTIGNSPFIIAKAQIDDNLAAGTNGEWNFFTAPFDYNTFTEPFDAQTLMDYGYNITIVATSSRQGDEFIGAIGSTLKIDELELICEK